MNLVLLLSLMPILPLQVSGEPPAAAPPRIARFLELCETTRRGAILQLEHELRKQKNAPASERSSARIAQLEARLRDLQTGHELIVPTISFPPQPGAIGRLPGNSCYVDQVISANEILVRCHFRVPVTAVRDFRVYRDSVVQPVTAVVRGWSQPVSEGQDTTTDEIFEVVGRERYTTQGGAVRQVLVLKQFDLGQLARYRDTASTAKAAKPVSGGVSGG